MDTKRMNKNHEKNDNNTLGDYYSSFAIFL